MPDYLGDGECKLCRIDLDSPNEVVHYRDLKIAILDAMPKKGHDKRIMVVIRKHAKEPEAELRKYALDCLIRFSRRYFPKYGSFIHGRMATIKDHYHKIASDWYGENVTEAFGKQPLPRNKELIL